MKTGNKITIRKFNLAEIKAYCVLSRSELKRMLSEIPADSESGECACGIFTMRVSADSDDGKVQTILEGFVRLPTELEYHCFGHKSLTVMDGRAEPTALPRLQGPHGATG